MYQCNVCKDIGTNLLCVITLLCLVVLVAPYDHAHSVTESAVDAVNDLEAGWILQCCHLKTLIGTATMGVRKMVTCY